MKIKITRPCSENWDEMKVGENMRFCDSCEKNVMDFTAMNREEIISLMLQNRNNHICGRMPNGLIDFSSEELMQVIDKELAKNTRNNYGFYLMLLGTLTMMSCNSDGSKLPSANSAVPITKPKTEVVDVKPIEFSKKVAQKTEASKSICKHEEDEDKGVKTFKGEVAINTPVGGAEIIQNVEDPNFIYTNVEKLPMFKGGMDALGKFITENLSYPDWEKTQKIEGRVFIQFIIEKDGRITYPLVLREPKDSKNLGKEAIRLIQSMPKWEPGRNHSELVRTSYVLPIAFKLD